MKFIGLVSGGKDSIYSICKLIDEGHTLVAILHVYTDEAYSDSYMFQTVGSEIARLQGYCLGVPIYTYASHCKALCTDLDYMKCGGDEVEDLFKAVKHTMESCSFEGVCSGAILSTYQKNRVINVCNRLGLESLAPLWNRNQKELLVEMGNYGIDARIIKVASTFLEKSCLNMNLKEINDYMINKPTKYEINYCGEGGEYETVVLDCPHFKNRIQPESMEICGHPEERGFSDGVFYLVMNNISTVSK